MNTASSDNSYDGVLNGTVKLITGLFGRAIDFSGNDCFVRDIEVF